MSNSAWSRNLSKNTALDAEVAVVLDLVEALEWNMGGYDEGKIKTHADCRKVWEFLTSDKLKASQFVWDGGSIIGRIIELERKTKI